MKSRISELMDGELGPHEAAAPLDAIRGEGELRDAWRSYHLIGDAMRGSRMLSAGFAGRVAAKLADEPTVVAPGRLPASAERARWPLLSVAAGVAAVAMVSSVWFMLQQGAGPAPQVAQAPKETAQAATPVAQVPPPASANDYLYAHQGYSPRNTLQGVAPYVRMVSGEERPEK